MNMTGSRAIERVTLTEGCRWLRVWALLLLPHGPSGSTSCRISSLLTEGPHCSHSWSLGLLNPGDWRTEQKCIGSNVLEKHGTSFRTIAYTQKVGKGGVVAYMLKVQMHDEVGFLSSCAFLR